MSQDWSNADGTKSFRLLGSMKRADMTAFLFHLARNMGLVEDGWGPAGTAAFSDVTDKTAHHTEIMWLAESGISEGWRMTDESRQFRSYADVARTDMTAFFPQDGSEGGRRR